MRVHADQATQLGRCFFRYWYTPADPMAPPDTDWTDVAEYELADGICAMAGPSPVDVPFLMSEPEPPDTSWTWRGAAVGVELDNVTGVDGSIWADNVQVVPCWPAPGFTGRLAYGAEYPGYLQQGASAPWCLYWAAYEDSAGVESYSPLVDSIVVDMEPPDGGICFPQPFSTVNGDVEITGHAFDPLPPVLPDTFFDRYRLEYRMNGSGEWTGIDPDSVSFTPVYEDDHLGYWKTDGLEEGDYWLRLTAYDSATNDEDFEAWVTVWRGGEEDFAAGPPGGGSSIEDGSIYVGSATGHIIHYNEALDSIGELFVSDTSGPANITAILNLGDSLLVADARAKVIHKLSRAGLNPRRLVSNLGAPAGLARDAGGGVWILDRGLSRVIRFRADGSAAFVKTRGTGDSLSLSQPEALAVANSQVGNRQFMYIADTRNKRLAVWDTAGTYLRSITAAGPTAVAVTDSGAIYVVDSAGRIQGMDPAGRRFLTITASDSSPFKCLLLSEDQHHLYTLQPSTNRVLKYRIMSDDTIPGGQQSAGRSQLPTSFVLYQPYPNPARASMHIRYGIPKQTRVAIKLFDITGRCCRTLLNTEQKPGYYDASWDGRDNAGRSMARGVYFCQMATDLYKARKKVVLLE